jgi:hypothetical protein
VKIDGKACIESSGEAGGMGVEIQTDGDRLLEVGGGVHL